MKSNNDKFRDNEIYFTNILNLLNEGGVFGWKDLGEVLIKRNGKLECKQKAYNKAKEITSKDFFDDFFKLSK